MTIAEPIRFLPQDFGIGHKLSYWAVGAVPMKSLNWGAKIGILGGAAHWGTLYTEEQAGNLSAKRRDESRSVTRKRDKKEDERERETEIIPFGYLQI